MRLDHPESYPAVQHGLQLFSAQVSLFIVVHG